MKMEIVTVKVRPSYNDRKMHVFRFCLRTESFSVNFIMKKLHELFPYGFFRPKIERYMVDYLCENDEVFSLCNHDYLAKYLISSEKLE